MKKKILIHIGVFAAVITALWLLLIITSAIPNSAIHSNMLESAVFYSDKNPFEFDENGRYNAVTDNFADAILLNVMWNIKSSSPFVSSLDTKYYDGDEYGENWGLYQTVNGTSANADYTRYWHGSVVFIRPLMLFTNIQGVKAVGFICILILIAVTLSLLIKGKHYFAATALLLSLIGVQFWNVRLSLEYIPAFMVCFTLCPLYIALEKKGDLFLTALSVAGGVMIAFFDFLTVETITLLVPIMLVLFIRKDDSRLGNFRDNLFLTIRCGICWGAAYIMTYAVKWTAATVVTGENKFTAALSAASVRLYGENGEESMPLFKQIPAAVAANISTLLGGTERITAKNLVLGIIIFIIFSAAVVLLFRKRKTDKVLTFIILILMIVPYLRYIVLNNHSYLHEFFTYRAQLPVIMGMLSVLWYRADYRQSKRR